MQITIQQLQIIEKWRWKTIFRKAAIFSKIVLKKPKRLCLLYNIFTAIDLRTC